MSISALFIKKKMIPTLASAFEAFTKKKAEAWREARNPKTSRVALEKIRPELYEKEMLEYESISMTWENWAASLFYIVLSIGPPQPLLTPMPRLGDGSANRHRSGPQQRAKHAVDRLVERRRAHEQEALEHALNLLTWYSDIEKNVKWITSRDRYFHPDNTDDFEEAD